MQSLTNLCEKHTIYGAPHRGAPQPAEQNIQSMGLSSVGRPQPAEQNIQSHEAIVRPENPEKKHTIQQDLLGGLVGWLSTTHAESPCRGKNVRARTGIPNKFVCNNWDP